MRQSKATKAQIVARTTNGRLPLSTKQNRLFLAVKMQPRTGEQEIHFKPE